jgi:uncharacterized membrane protein YeaQ/YmgE (transglycosylase-associated protein family)
MRANLKTSFRDLLVTGWLIIFGVTVGVVAFHPAYQGQGTLGVLELSGLTIIGVVGGVLLTIYVNRLGASSPRSRKIALALFVASAVALVPVMFVTFASPWLALIVLTLLYVRWKWALVSTSD